MAFNFYSNTPDTYKLKRTSDDDKYCLLKFSQCDDKYPMYKLNKEHLKEFIRYAKKVENMTWKEIKTHVGLNYETLSGIGKPDNVPKDVTLTSMRMSQKSRIIGYKQENFYYIVWFDINHKSC